MALDNFDENIKQSLDGLEEEYDALSWDKLSSQLDKLEADSVDQMDGFIPAVKEKLENYKEEVKDSHWQILKKELDEIDQRRHRLWSVKLIESVILLLLVFTYWNYNNIKKSDSYNFSPLSEQSFAENSTIENFITPINIEIKESKETRSFEGYSQDRLLRAGRIEFKSQQGIPALAIGSIANSKPFTKSAILSKIVSDHVSSPVTNEKENIQRIAVLEIKHVSGTSTNQKEVPLYSEVDLKKKKSKNDGFWLSIPFSQDINLVNSGINLSYIRSQVNSGLYGTSVGILGSYQKNNLEIESGIRYSEKSYAPGLIRNFTKSSIDSYLETRLDRIDFRQIQIPVVLKLHALSNTNSNLYAMAGVGMNAIMDYNYSLEKTVQPSARVTALSNSVEVDLSELPIGLANGGPIDDNMYMTAIVGFGFQSILRNNTALFLQPQYQFSFLGGANNYIRRVNSINIEAGVRFKF